VSLIIGPEMLTSAGGGWSLFIFKRIILVYTFTFQVQSSNGASKLHTALIDIKSFENGCSTIEDGRNVPDKNYYTPAEFTAVI
jgi:hypothetical protein